MFINKTTKPQYRRTRHHKRKVHPSFDLSQKAIVVTGGNRGIGLGMAKGLIESGAKVMIWGRSEVCILLCLYKEYNTNACRLLNDIAGEQRAFKLEVDVAKEKEVSDAMVAAFEVMDGIDGCITSAGIVGKQGIVLMVGLWCFVVFNCFWFE